MKNSSSEDFSERSLMIQFCGAQDLSPFAISDLTTAVSEYGFTIQDRSDDVQMICSDVAKFILDDHVQVTYVHRTPTNLLHFLRLQDYLLRESSFKPRYENGVPLAAGWIARCGRRIIMSEPVKTLEESVDVITDAIIQTRLESIRNV